jgi:glycosyltransferase involved in cell wall biosynthesis
MSAIEAFACGKPVIGARLGGVPELVEDGVDGILFDPGDAESLSKCIETMVGSTALALRMGENARKKAEQRYSATKYLSSLLDVYERLLNRSLRDGR